MIDRSSWNMLWLLVPFSNIIFAVFWCIDFLERFGQSPLWVIASFFPATDLLL
jgi:hypothetical protein